MESRELEDLALLFIRDAAEPTMWIDRWAVSYPIAQQVEVSRTQNIETWQQLLNEEWLNIQSKSVAMVAHGVGVSALLAWLYLADTDVQRRIQNVILVAPVRSTFPDDDCHTLQRVRFQCKTALVIGQNDADCPADWAAQQADNWRAKLLVSPHDGHLNSSLHGWQWGMKLMQEMLLS
ncbi:MAG: alpha/beta hydrolase [Neisseria sp.]